MTAANVDPSRIDLPDAPAEQAAILAAGGVACWSEAVSIDTYEPAEPDRYPLFLDRRVYQGSSGRVYPMPFIERVSREKVARDWQAIHIETEYIRLMLLPEIGGRIHIGYDKTADYDFFYRNNVIKPALVGLAGPWISGGVEFNWPQHHRPTTFLGVETDIERSDDGAVTVWHSSIDALQGIRGTYGVRLRPGSSLIEVDARLHNPGDEPQTFLWWANVAARSHDEYQSFFPTDVRFVADHARRAITAFPRADRPYYGVDYAALAESQPGADRIDLYGNIPVPTSYMITDTRDDFFGGYDHRVGAGFVHWADHTISPGKKQWTWGNGPVGHAWDAHLTDADGPYVELMAGVYTDNQPDFSYIAPAETRRFSQFWYPIREMGPAHQATRDAAVSLTRDGDTVRVGVSAATLHPSAVVRVTGAGSLLREWTVELSPGSPFVGTTPAPVLADHELEVTVHADGRELVSWRPRPVTDAVEPWAAEEPSAPAEIDSADELYQTGVHLAQYRHPTRSPIPYFEEALRRDPGDARAAIAIGSWRYRRGEYPLARTAFETALARLTRRNLNPASGEASYRLGLVLERTGELDEAHERFAKAAWDAAWARPAHLALARLALRRGATEDALAQLATARHSDAPSPEATHLTIIALRRAGRDASAILGQALAADALDPVLLALAGRLDVDDPNTAVAVASALARAGEVDAALALTDAARSGTTALGNPAFGNPAPMRHYRRALWLETRGEDAAAERAAAASADSTLAFPSGLDDFDALSAAITADPGDVVATALLGAWLLDAGRLDDARGTLLASTDGGSIDPVAWRNAAISVVKTGGDLDEADDLFARALELSPDDARLAFERDLLAGLRTVPSAERLRTIEGYDRSVLERDDLMLATLNLLVDERRVDEAIDILESRWFQPFEGGEGQVIAAWDRATIAGARNLLASDPSAAVAELERTARVPANLGEGRHPGTSQAERFVLLGDALDAVGDTDRAALAWARARTGTPLAVADRPVTAADSWVGIAHARLGETHLAEAVWSSLDERADELESGPLTVDYFATSLPELLLFDTDTAASRAASAAVLRELAASGRSLSERVPS